LLHFAAMEVNLTKRIETPDGSVPVIVAANGRVKPNWVLVNGRPEKYEAGIYYLDWRENGKRQRLSVGRDSDAAHQRKIRKLAELRALSQSTEQRQAAGQLCDTLPTTGDCNAKIFKLLSCSCSQSA
jgi:hypothetical protein